MTIQRALTGFVLCGLALPSYAAVLVEQPSVPIGNPATAPASVFSSLADAVFEESQVWDNFSLSDDATISQINWKGAFENPFNPDDNLRGGLDFQITIYADSGSGPDLSSSLFTVDLDSGSPGRNDGTQVREFLVADETLGINTAPGIPGGPFTEGGPVANYEADLSSFSLPAGDYWLSIQAMQTFLSEDYNDPAWAWVFGTGGTGGIFSYDEAFGDTVKPGLQFGRETSFSIIGEFGTVVGITGDFDSNGALEANDLDLLSDAIRNGPPEARFDLNNDGEVTADDHSFWVSDIKKTIPGDANLDFSVAFDDFLTLSGSFGTTGGWADGNFDTDLDIDFADFLALSGNFGVTVSPAAAASVPEPSTAVLCGLGLLIVGTVRRRRTV